jgi:hypothetical protein
MFFNSLPPEIHLRIMDFLDSLSYIRFTQTNHYFRSLRRHNHLARCLLELETESPQNFILEGVLPCYGCLNVVRSGDLAMVWSRILYGNTRNRCYKIRPHNCPPLAVGGPKAHARRCKACDEAEGSQFSIHAYSLVESLTPIGKNHSW